MQRNPVIKHYKDIAKFSIAPIYYPIKMINHHGEYDFAGPVIGCLLLPWSPLVTPITLSLGIVGLVGYSFVAPFEAAGYAYAKNHPNKKDKMVKDNYIINIDKNTNQNNKLTYISEIQSIKDNFNQLKNESDDLLKDVEKILQPIQLSKLTQTSSNLFSSPSKMVVNEQAYDSDKMKEPVLHLTAKNDLAIISPRQV